MTTTPCEVVCLGWCGKKFLSKNKITIRYCKRCREKKRGIEEKRTGIRYYKDGDGTYDVSTI